MDLRGALAAVQRHCRPSRHNYYLQWRNVSATGGYDSALGDPRWRYGPANTGLLVWYNNNFYTDNEVFNYLTDYLGFGPKGRMLVVDSHPDPYRDPDLVAQGYNNEAGNLARRGHDARCAVHPEGFGWLPYMIPTRGDRAAKTNSYRGGRR